MADQRHIYDVTIDGVDYEVDSPSELSDAQAYQAAKAQHAVSSSVLASRTAALVEANKKPLPATPSLADEFTPSKMGKRALLGVKGEVEGAAGALAAPAVMLYHTIAHPVDTAKAVGQTALGAAGLVYQSAQHPRETLNSAVDAATQFGLNPEAIGAAAGATGAAIAMPTIIGAAKGTRLGKAVVAGVSDAANRIPGVQAARKVYAGPTVIAPKVKAVKLPPSLDEQLGVSPTATGAVMDSLPDTAAADARLPVMLAHDSARTAEAADAVRGNNAALGVAAEPPLAPSAVLEHPESMPSAAVPGARERIPVPVRQSVNPDAVTSGTKAASFDDLARQLGLDPSKLRETPDDIFSRATSAGGRYAADSDPVPLPGVSGLPTDAELALAGVSAPEGAPAADLTGLSREELAKELMARFAQKNGGVAPHGTRKRGGVYGGHKD